MAVNKRVYARKLLRTVGEISDVTGEMWRPVTLMDISCGGAAFVTEEELAAGSFYMFRCQLPDSVVKSITLIKVVYCVAHPYLTGNRAGVEFVRMHEDDRARIARFVEDESADQDL